MRKLLIPVAAIIFTGTVNAATDEEIYRGFAKDNLDLSSDTFTHVTRTAVQPGIGAGAGLSRSSKVTDNDIYHGFEKGNLDLSTSSWTSYSASVPGIGSASGQSYSRYSDNDVYHGFEKDNLDL